ncbi:MAG: diguanylate cyclase [Epsilonproteobacteria bacterium]|nr:diguanylate cyclase [Campylobacterota bacterium]
MRVLILMLLFQFIFAKNIYIQDSIKIEVPKIYSIRDYSKKTKDFVGIITYNTLDQAIQDGLYIIKGIKTTKTYIISHKPLDQIHTVGNLTLPAKIFFDAIKQPITDHYATLRDFQHHKVDAIISDKYLSIKHTYVYDLNLLGIKFNKYYIVATPNYVQHHQKEINALITFFGKSKFNISPILTALYLHKKVNLSHAYRVYFRKFITDSYKVVVTPYWPPFNVLVDGKLQGIVVDMWKLIAKKASIDYEFIIEPIWQEVLKGIKTHKYDIIPGTSKTPDRAKYAIFSKPYFTFPFGIACQEGLNIRKITDIKSLAVGYNYTAHKIMKLHYPHMHFIPAKSVLDAFKLVEHKQAQCVVDMLPIVVWVMNQGHAGSLKLMFKTPFQFKLQVMMRKDMTPLKDKIDIAIDNLNVFEKNKIIIKYLGEGYLTNSYYSKLIYLAIIVFVLILMIVWYKAHEYKQISQKDALTHIYNRGALEVLFRKLIKHHSGSIVFFDIDHFKQINDTYGHDKGDLVLKKLADVIKHHIRENDIFGRWGGEEFIIILPDQDLTKGLKVAEKLRKVVEETDFDGLKVTISLGISQFERGERIDDVIKRADEAMYQAKTSGRNRVVSFEK